MGQIFGTLLSRSRASPSWRLPSGAWDTHVHVFDSSIGPFAAGRAYTPAQALLSQLKSFISTISQDGRPLRLVLVQPSPYHTDNKVLLHTLRQLRDEGSVAARGIAVVDVPTIQDEELWEMHELGVRGLRLNMQANGRGVDIDKLRALILQAADRIKGLPDWKLQLFCPAQVWDDLYATIRTLPVQVIADHIGGLLGSSKLEGAKEDQNFGHQLNQPGFKSLISLAQESKVIVKVSGLYRASTRNEEGFDDLEPIIRALATSIPDGLVWASDWPHTGEGKDRKKRNLDHIEDFRPVDNEAILKNIRAWMGDDQAWRKMMVDTPAMVYR
ncbi:hypothetical protein B0T10DRAFT_607429 [Thelonectria olida]|uniref:Amidohydrolase-related domain-containing protein n=1 Tax=Thelonectria olida TaxID=1576542 RepID=A0A9P9AKK2_9HYPO|nr:hypothetical protein B0T10DRAFT_607429 [Thelonectria olida]